MQGLTPRVSKVRQLLPFLDIGQHNALKILKIFAVKRNIVSKISKVLLNDIFAEFEAVGLRILLMID